MNLSAPTNIVFIISIILAVVSLIAQYGNINLGFASYYWALIAYIVLAAGTLVRGM